MLWKLTKLKCKTVFIILPLLLKLCENFPWQLHVISKTVKLPYYRQGAEKDSVQQYTGKYQNNIANCSKDSMYSEIGRFSGMNKYVVK